MWIIRGYVNGKNLPDLVYDVSYSVRRLLNNDCKIVEVRMFPEPDGKWTAAIDIESTGKAYLLDQVFSSWDSYFI